MPNAAAALAQLVEHIIRNDGVRCSSHLSGTNNFSNLSTLGAKVIAGLLTKYSPLGWRSPYAAGEAVLRNPTHA
jgi:hypothetical protein